MPVLSELKRARDIVSKQYISDMLTNYKFSLRRVTQANVELQRDQNRVINQIKRVFDDVQKYNVPRALTLNADETGIINPKTTFEAVGSKQAPVNGFGNKTQITALQCVAADGTVLDVH